MPYRLSITEIWNNLRIRQAMTLYAASFAGIPLSIVTSIVFTRFLGPQGYGDFAFLGSLFDFAVIIFPMGFFYAGNRALVLNHDKVKAREYYGAGLVYLGILFVLMAVALFVYGLIDPNLSDKGLGRFFLYLLPFSWIFLMQPFFDNMLHADNRISELAATRIMPKIITFTSALIIYFLASDFTGNRLAIIWPVYMFAFLSVYVLVLVRIRVSFRNLKERMGAIRKHHRTYGIHLYTGILFSAGAISLTGILLSYFSDDNTGVGFFTLAVAIARPMALIPGVIATTWFKDFASQERMGRKLFLNTMLLSVISLAGLWLLAGPFIRFFYSDDFLPVIFLVHLSGIGMLLYGIGSYYNRFLEAKGQGKSVRNTHIAMGLVLLVSNLILIPVYGPEGAAAAMIIASAVYCTGMWAFYRRWLKQQQPSVNNK